MAATIPGDPASIRAGAAKLETCRALTGLADGQVGAARATATGGPWTGAAHDAFDGAADRTAGRVRVFARFADAAAPLYTYATALEEAQRAYAAAYAQYNAGAARPDGAADTVAQTAAVQAMGAAQRAAHDANQVAATAIETLGDGIASDADAARDATSLFSTTVGNALNAFTAITEGGSGSRYGTSLLGDDVPSWASTSAKVLKYGVPGLTGVLAGVGQLADDWDNPYLSVGERIMRPIAQGVSVGAGGLVGGTVGDFAGGAALGGIGLLAGPEGAAVGAAVGSIVGGAAGGYAGATGVDSVNDGFVDGAGRLGDRIEDGFKEAPPLLTSW